MGKRNGAKVGLDQAGFEMGTKHKHYDVIVAWAAGEEVEIKDDDGVWVAFKNTKHVIFYEDMEYRIKPKRVKKEGWVAVYGGNFTSEIVHQTKAECVAKCPNAIVYVRIEWEEEA